MNFSAIKNFDWKSLNKLFSPKALDDLNLFLEKIPSNTNNTLLIIVGVIWGSAAALGLYTTIKMQEFVELSVEYDKAESMLPAIPKIQDKPVDSKSIKKFVDELQAIYKDLEIKGNSSNIVIRAKSTAQFGQFREAIGHVQNGGSGWRVNVDKLCVGKECPQNPLAALLRINKVSVANN